MATPAGTDRYRERHEEEFAARYFQEIDGCPVSSIGAGTYLGDPTDEVDEQYYEALVTALERGINVIDTAINYRCQRSERVVARAVEDADVDREEVLVATKGGYVPFDGSPPEDLEQHLRREYVEPGLIDPADLTEGLHCMDPEFLDHQLDQSLSNLGMDTIDLYYVHNPEMQFSIRSREAVYDQLEAAFTRLESRAAEGDIRWYGMATWDAFRVGKDGDVFLPLSEVLARARAAADTAGNDEHHLQALQMPFNPVMGDAFTHWVHDTDEGDMNVMNAAEKKGLSVFTSATLAQGQLAEKMPEEVGVWFEGETPAQRTINFARSAPAVTSALVGMRSPEHVEENLQAGTYERMGSDAFSVVFEGSMEAEHS